ncbi:RNA polymerase sigma-70 factor [Fodinibius salsisoli]|uniref:RNA polymerase sigma-70 factor n=1 Tax=Fodinibius salsisoli TaxID=2820877 RepID=A0ABT3PKL8_9BACT|nr:RNA polymerase sigma-70 factor [Fodinibius salsisoli]MCW9706485.1 RNA polymerase sigma-70 factor [Fodinibius salsisoli]
MGVEETAKKNRIYKIQKGDEHTFECLFKEYYLHLTRFAWRYVKSKAIAEELVQEVFANIWENRSTWSPAGPIKAYLYQAVKHRALDHLKHEEVRQEYDPKWMDNKEHPTIDFEDQFRRKQLRKAIKKEIEALPSRSKMTYKLHRYDGLTYKEIAQVMDVSVKTVESQMTRTLKRLRERLAYLLPFILVATLTM